MTDPASTPRRSPARAVVSLHALHENARRLRASMPQHAQPWADLRRDAWGHGVRETAPMVAEAGFGIVVDDDVRAEIMKASPNARVRTRSQAGTVDGGAVDGGAVDPAGLWGLPAADADTGTSTPVMSLHGVVLSTKPLHAGEGVSYGYTFRAAHDTTVALLAGGYAQGVVRELGNRARVRIGTLFARIVGRVAMDACVVDIGEGRCAVGDDVVFFGDPDHGAPGLATWTRLTGLAAGEIVSLAGARAVREYTVRECAS